jgi:hypothetical protein
MKFKIFIDGEILVPPKRPDNWKGFMEGKIKLGIERLLKVNVVKMNVRVHIDSNGKPIMEVIENKGLNKNVQFPYIVE